MLKYTSLAILIIVDKPLFWRDIRLHVALSLKYWQIIAIHIYISFCFTTWIIAKRVWDSYSSMVTV